MHTFAPASHTTCYTKYVHLFRLHFKIYRVEQRKRLLFKWPILGKGGVDDVGHESAESSDNAVSVAMAHWNVEHHVFVIEQFFRNSDSVVAVQRLSC